MMMLVPYPEMLTAIQTLIQHLDSHRCCVGPEEVQETDKAIETLKPLFANPDDIYKKKPTNLGYNYLAEHHIIETV